MVEKKKWRKKIFIRYTLFNRSDSIRIIRPELIFTRIADLSEFSYITDKELLGYRVILRMRLYISISFRKLNFQDYFSFVYYILHYYKCISISWKFFFQYNLIFYHKRIVIEFSWLSNDKFFLTNYIFFKLLLILFENFTNIQWKHFVLENGTNKVINIF